MFLSSIIKKQARISKIIYLFLILFVFGFTATGQVLIEEDLRGGRLPTGWSENNVSFTIVAGGYANFSGNSGILETNSFDASANATLDVSLSVAKFGSGADGPITVEYSINGGGFLGFCW